MLQRPPLMIAASALLYLLPHFNNAIPAASKHSRGLDRMPHRPDRRTLVVSLVLLQRPRALEVPEEELTIAVPAADETPVGADGDIARVTGDVMTLHLPLPLQ